MDTIKNYMGFSNSIDGLNNYLANAVASDISKKILDSWNLDMQRKILSTFFSKWQEDNIMPIKLDIPSDLLKDIITDKKVDEETNSICRKFIYSLNELQMLDFSDFDFSEIIVDGIDFSKLKGVKIDPQSVNCGSLQGCNFAGVTFIGSFKDTDIRGCNFTGSKGAVIVLSDLQDIRGINGKSTILNDAKVVRDELSSYKLNSETVISDGALIVKSNQKEELEDLLYDMYPQMKVLKKK